jgi:hypothetical protein
VILFPHIDLVGRAVLELFSGVCDFGQEVGINHYQDVYSFEGGLSDAWSSWAGGLPQVSEEEAFCGRHSLFVSLMYIKLSGELQNSQIKFLLAIRSILESYIVSDLVVHVQKR